MRFGVTCAALSLLVMLARPAAAETVRDPAGDFTLEVTDPKAQLCTSLPASDDAGAACTALDLTMGQALSKSALHETRALALVVAHMGDWETSVVVTRTEAHDAEVTQSGADAFVGGLRDGIRKRLPPGADLVDADQPAQAVLLRIGQVQVVRGIVRIRHGNDPALAMAKSKIAYQVIAKSATYVVLFSVDDAHFDEALAFAERTAATIRTSPAAPAPSASQGLDRIDNGRLLRTGLFLGLGAVVLFALVKWRTRR